MLNLDCDKDILYPVVKRNEALTMDGDAYELACTTCIVGEHRASSVGQIYTRRFPPRKLVCAEEALVHVESGWR